MDKKQQNQYRMGGLTTTLLTQRAAELAASPAAQREAADVQAAYQALQTSVGQGPTSTKENTEAAATARHQALHLLPALLGPLRAVARKTGNTELLAQATISAKQLGQLRPAPLRDVLQHLLEQAATYQKELTDYGITDAVYQQVSDAVTAFARSVGTTKGLLNTSQSTTQTIEELLGTFMRQCYELDDVMEAFRVLNPALYRDYQQARKVGKSGGGPGNDSDNNPDNGPAPGPA